MAGGAKNDQSTTARTTGPPRTKVAVLLAIDHPAQFRRAKVFGEALRPRFDVDVYVGFRRKGETLIHRWFESVRLLRRVAKREYVAVHVLGLSFLLPPLLKVASRGRCRVVYDACNIQVGVMETLGRGRVVRGIVRTLEEISVRSADMVVACGVTFAEYFAKHQGRTEGVRFVPDPVDVSKYPGARSTPEPLGAPGSSAGPLKVVYTSTFETILVGGRSKPRGWELIEALSSPNDSPSSAIAIDFVGSGGALGELKDLAMARGLAPNCKFCGFLSPEEFVNEVSSADIGFMEDYDTLGYRYSVGSKVQEYMAAGLPVITSNAPEKRYMLEEQAIGELLFPPMSVRDPRGEAGYLEDLRKSLRYAADHRAEIRAAGIRNRSRAERTFGVPVVESLLRAVYDELVPPADHRR